MSGALGLSRRVLRLPPAVRAEHLIPLSQTDRLTLASPSPLISLPKPTPQRLPSGFHLFPTFFSEKEQETLLESALMVLDKRGIRRDPVSGRKIRRSKQEITTDKESKGGLQGWFMDEQAYEFEDGHFDGVIKGFRETSISHGLPDLPGSEKSFKPTPSELVAKLDYMFDDPQAGENGDVAVEMHAIHLGSKGRIDGHVDGVESMGRTIVGVSLGAARVMRLEKDKIAEGEQDEGPIDVLLQSGSVYVQTGESRYDYKHSILEDVLFDGHEVEPGQRVSIMLRDKFIPAPPPSPPSIYGTFGGSEAVLPPSAGEFYTPLSLRDEAVLKGEDFRLVDELPWTYEEEKHRLATSISRVERHAMFRQRRERTNFDLIKQGMKNRKWGGK